MPQPHLSLTCQGIVLTMQCRRSRPKNQLMYSNDIPCASPENPHTHTYPGYIPVSTCFGGLCTRAVFNSLVYAWTDCWTAAARISKSIVYSLPLRTHANAPRSSASWARSSCSAEKTTTGVPGHFMRQSDKNSKPSILG